MLLPTGSAWSWKVCAIAALEVLLNAEAAKSSRIGHGEEHHARLLRLPGYLHSEPARLARGKDVCGQTQAAGSRPEDHHRVTVSVEQDVLSFQP